MLGGITRMQASPIRSDELDPDVSEASVRSDDLDEHEGLSHDEEARLDNAHCVGIDCFSLI